MAQFGGIKSTTKRSIPSRVLPNKFLCLAMAGCALAATGCSSTIDTIRPEINKGEGLVLSPTLITSDFGNSGGELSGVGDINSGIVSGSDSLAKPVSFSGVGVGYSSYTNYLKGFYDGLLSLLNGYSDLFVQVSHVGYNMSGSNFQECPIYTLSYPTYSSSSTLSGNTVGALALDLCSTNQKTQDSISTLRKKLGGRSGLYLKGDEVDTTKFLEMDYNSLDSDWKLMWSYHSDEDLKTFRDNVNSDDNVIGYLPNLKAYLPNGKEITLNVIGNGSNVPCDSKSTLDSILTWSEKSIGSGLPDGTNAGLVTYADSYGYVLSYIDEWGRTLVVVNSATELKGDMVTVLSNYLSGFRSYRDTIGYPSNSLLYGNTKEVD